MLSVLLEAVERGLSCKIAGMIRHISAVTFPVRDMARSIGFYKMVGFELVYGGDRSSFSSLQASEAFVNLLASPNYESRWSGRTIFRVENVDGHYQGLRARGLAVEVPRNATWGERFFHVTDPDGHELSFAELLPAHL